MAGQRTTRGLGGSRGRHRGPFQGGSIYYSPATGSHAVYGAIGTEFAATANLRDAYGVSVQSILGLPTSDEQNVPGVSGTRFVSFQGGTIYWSAGTGAPRRLRGHRPTICQPGRAAGTLGLPVGDEQAWAGGRLVPFQNGQITWSAANGAQVLGPTYQANDQAGHLVTYVLQGGQTLYEATGTSLQPVTGPTVVNQVVVDGQHNLFALDYDNVLWQVSGLTAQQANTGVTRVAVDSAGEVARAPGGESVWVYHGRPVHRRRGDLTSGPTTYALDPQGRLYSLSAGILTETDTGLSTPRQLATGVTQVAVDSAGEVAMLLGPHQYQYFVGALTIGGSTISTSGPVQYALDTHGALYGLSGGILTVTATSGSKPYQVATGVTQMAVDSAGEVVYLQGSHSYNYIGDSLGTGGGVVTSGDPSLFQYALDGQGRLFTLNNGTLSIENTQLESDHASRLAGGPTGDHQRGADRLPEYHRQRLGIRQQRLDHDRRERGHRAGRQRLVPGHGLRGRSGEPGDLPHEQRPDHADAGRGQPAFGQRRHSGCRHRWRRPVRPHRERRQHLGAARRERRDLARQRSVLGELRPVAASDRHPELQRGHGDRFPDL